jgi:hypothetical protein
MIDWTFFAKEETGNFDFLRRNPQINWKILEIFRFFSPRASEDTCYASVIAS